MIKKYFVILLICIARTEEEKIFVSTSNDFGRDKTSKHNFVERNIIEKIQFNSDEIKSIVDYVNFIRNTVKPQSTDMRMLAWSNNLANLAEEWAENCEVKFGPPGCRKNITQLIYNEPEEDSFRAVTPFTKWREEMIYFNYSTNRCKKGFCTNYKKLIRSESHSIGCARKKCGTAGNTTNFVVCNIYPGVNLKMKLYDIEGFCMCAITRKERCKFLCYKQMDDCLPLCLHTQRVPDAIMGCKNFAVDESFNEIDVDFDEPSARSFGVMLMNKVQLKILFSILVFHIVISRF